MKRMFASPGGSVIPGTLWAESCASTEETAPRTKIRIITIGLLRDLSEIKLKRTDTTLDLSQKAKRAKEEKKRKSFAFRWARENYIGRRERCVVGLGRICFGGRRSSSSGMKHRVYAEVDVDACGFTYSSE
jgi:hypothetical protein